MMHTNETTLGTPLNGSTATRFTTHEVMTPVLIVYTMSVLRSEYVLCEGSAAVISHECRTWVPPAIEVLPRAIEEVP